MEQNDRTRPPIGTITTGQQWLTLAELRLQQNKQAAEHPPHAYQRMAIRKHQGQLVLAGYYRKDDAWMNDDLYMVHAHHGGLLFVSMRAGRGGFRADDWAHARSIIFDLYDRDIHGFKKAHEQTDRRLCGKARELEFWLVMKTFPEKDQRPYWKAFHQRNGGPFLSCIPA